MVWQSLPKFWRNTQPPFSRLKSRPRKQFTTSRFCCLAYTSTMKMETLRSSKSCIDLHKIIRITSKKTVGLLFTAIVMRTSNLTFTPIHCQLHAHQFQVMCQSHRKWCDSVRKDGCHILRSSLLIARCKPRNSSCLFIGLLKDVLWT